MDTSKVIKKVKYGSTEIPLKTLQLQEGSADPKLTDEVYEPDESHAGFSKFTVHKVETEEKSVTPSTEAQEIEPEEGKLISKVNVSAVTHEIDNNIQPNNIRQGVVVLGITGNLAPDKPDQTKSVDPSTEPQTVRADAGFELAEVNVTAVQTEEKVVNPSTSSQEITPTSGKFISKVTVPAVQASIDPNIAPNNIKLGVTILGVAGNVEPDKPDQEKTVTPSTSQQEVVADTGYELAKVTVEAIVTEEKTANPTTEEQSITPTSGKFLTKVTIGAIPTEEKSVDPTTSQQEITPTSGKFMTKVTVSAIQTETKSVTPTEENQVITPSDGKFLAEVDVGAIPEEYIIPEGSINITENGTVDVTELASVVVNVGGSTGGMTKYHIEQIDLGNGECELRLTTYDSQINDNYIVGDYPVDDNTARIYIVGE